MICSRAGYGPRKIAKPREDYCWSRRSPLDVATHKLKNELQLRHSLRMGICRKSVKPFPSVVDEELHEKRNHQLRISTRAWQQTVAFSEKAMLVVSCDKRGELKIIKEYFQLCTLISVVVAELQTHSLFFLSASNTICTGRSLEYSEAYTYRFIFSEKVHLVVTNSSLYISFSKLYAKKWLA